MQKNLHLQLKAATNLRTQAPFEACVEISITLFLPQSLPKSFYCIYFACILQVQTSATQPIQFKIGFMMFALFFNLFNVEKEEKIYENLCKGENAI